MKSWWEAREAENARLDINYFCVKDELIRKFCISHQLQAHRKVDFNICFASIKKSVSLIDRRQKPSTLHTSDRGDAVKLFRQTRK